MANLSGEPAVIQRALDSIPLDLTSAQSFPRSSSPLTMLPSSDSFKDSFGSFQLSLSSPSSALTNHLATAIRLAGDRRGHTAPAIVRPQQCPTFPTKHGETFQQSTIFPRQMDPPHASLKPNPHLQSTDLLVDPNSRTPFFVNHNINLELPLVNKGL